MTMNRRQWLVSTGLLGVAGCSGDIELVVAEDDVPAAPEDDVPAVPEDDVDLEPSRLRDAPPDDTLTPSDATARFDAGTPRDVPRASDLPAAPDVVSDPGPRPDVVSDPGPRPDVVSDPGPRPDVVTVPTDVVVPIDRPMSSFGFDPFGLPVNVGAFPQAAMAGDMTTNSVILWTKYLGPDPLAVRVEEQVGGGFQTRFEARLPTGSGNKLIEATGLTPGARHRFVFFTTRGTAGVARSAVGLFRTAFAPGAREVLTFGGLSCTNGYRPGSDDFGVLRRLSTERDLDLLLHLGDHIYADYNDPSNQPSASTRAEFDTRYNQHYSLVPFRSMHLTTGWYFTWDDHEVRNNWDPQMLPASVRTNARAAWFDHHPVRRNPAAPDRIWRSFRWGDTAEFFILDGRSERQLSSMTYMSRAQMDWLKSSLAASTAVFKFIVSSKPITAGGDDSWFQFLPSRDEIVGFITSTTRRIPGVVWLGGDVHYGGVSRVASGLYDVIMGPGANDRPELLDYPLTGAREILVRNAANRALRNYTVIRADPNTRTATVSFFGADAAPIPNSSFSITV